TLNNCTLAANVAGTFGGGILLNGGGALQLANCVAWNNSDSNGVVTTSQIQVLSGTTSVTYSVVQGGWAAGGTGNVSVSSSVQLFVRNPSPGPDSNTNGLPDDWDGVDDDYGDLHPAALSPLIDAGRNASVPPDSADLNCNGNRLERTPQDITGSPR